ncbi:CIR protein PIR protein [Plasmodium vinckei vinckei]|uniref:CIR protein PIR protein n=1 Tax=Plasmodium vinckei vinckei TaxID=54757 RepID=A0A449BM91_PLAVN|nr:CIR protein PIR protein [Plasmodium vinckei vinckei]VEV54544.1 CIR protein PIR protein [Plasmodium vinckei vinckei]
MAESCYNFKDVYTEFNKINGYFSEIETSFGPIILSVKGPIHKYCHYNRTSNSNKCLDYFEMASSGVIHLLETLKDKFDSKYDKLAEYAILWLSYKLSIKPKNKMTDLNKFYTNYIGKNKHYNNKIKDNDLTYKDIIDKKKDLMDMNINEISKFYEVLKTLCNIYSECNKSELDCKKCSQKANEFVQKFKELNKDSKNIENSSYNKMLSILSDDYNNLINTYYNDKSCDFSSIPKIKPEKNSEQDDAEIFVATSSSSILNTVIPGLSTFSVIPVFLGVAYKTIYKKTIKKSKEENET